MRKIALIGCAAMLAFTISSVSSVYAMGNRAQSQKEQDDASASSTAQNAPMKAELNPTTTSTVPPATDSGLDNNAVPAETESTRPNSVSVPNDPQAGIPGQRAVDVNSDKLSQP